MISTPINKYYHFGRVFRYLLDAKEGYLTDGIGYIVSNIQSLLNHINDLGLEITARSQPYSNLVKFDTEIKNDVGGRLSKDQATNLLKIMNELDIVLDAEIRGFNSYIVSPKMIDVQKLLNNVPSLFSPKIFNKLPPIAQRDLEEAGKSIAFELPTAAAFHLLRATESVLREFYLKLIKKGRIKNLMWGNIVQDLGKKNNAKPYGELIKHLDHIREAFRNPTQHPEKVYDIHEAQDLWSLCVDSINRMSKIL